MSPMQWVMVMILVVLVTEILSGWHKGIYRRHDLLVTGGCILFSQLTRPLSAMLYAGLFAIALPDYRGVLSGAPFVVPYAWVMGLAFYLGLEAASATVLGILLSWNALTHSALRWDDVLARTPWGSRVLQAVEWLFITPRLHHTHHGYGKDGKTYRNYAVMITVWDRLFGTLHVPAGRPANYGVPGKDKHWSEEIFFPVIRRRQTSTVVPSVHGD